MTLPKRAAATLLAAISMMTLASTQAAQVAPLPEAKSQGSLIYITGGVGKEEAQAMKQAARTYPLSLEFVHHALPRDEYLADVSVLIKDHAGRTVLDTVSDGPFLLAKVPPGKYTVTATVNGKSKTTRATIAARKPDHVVMVW
jgi:hypothetical protein